MTKHYKSKDNQTINQTSKQAHQNKQTDKILKDYYHRNDFLQKLNGSLSL